jgi:hypothetical protein
MSTTIGAGEEAITGGILREHLEGIILAAIILSIRTITMTILSHI